MTKREIIKTLLAKQIPDRVGLHEHFWPFLIPNAWEKQGLPAGTDLAKHFDLDIRSIGWCLAPDPRPDLKATLEETDAWKITRNGWGATFKNWKSRAGTPEHMGFMCTSPDVWAAEFRDAIVGYDMRRTIDLPKFRQQYAAAMAGEAFVTYSGLFVFEEMRRIMGDQAMLEALLLEPAWIHDFNSVITAKHIEWFNILFDEVGLPDGIHIYEDLGYTAAPFASPACHRELVLPYHKKLFGMFKDHKLPIIVHTCGDFRPHIDSLIEAGTDCIQALEAKTGMNVLDLAATYKSKLCFMGNIDVRALESGNRDTIKQECLGKLNGMKALRAPYVYMSDHSISTGVSLESYRYMLELYHENCKY